MYCRNCGSVIDENSKYCKTCGFLKDIGIKYCYSCGKTIEYENVEKCPKCGVLLKEEKKKEINIKQKSKSLLVAGLLQVFIPFFSLGNFYLGFYKKALIQLAVVFFTFGLGFIWPFIDGLRILNGKIKVDAHGLPLND